MPISLLCFKHKNKDIQFFSLLLPILIFVMILMFIAVQFLNFSTYYYCKFNFLLWFVLWYGAIITINSYSDQIKYKITLTLYVIFYLILTTLVFSVGTPITKEYYTKETLMNAFDIYGINKTIALKVDPDFTKEDMELINYIRYNMNLENGEMLVIAAERQEHWIYALLNYKYREESEMEIFDASEVSKWNNGEQYKNSIVFYDCSKYRVIKDYFVEKNVLFENEKGVIYENY